MDAGGLTAYARICGAILARAHARTGDRIAIASYLGSGAKFDQAIARFAAAYADQNERDYAALREAARNGRITVARAPEAIHPMRVMRRPDRREIDSDLERRSRSMSRQGTREGASSRPRTRHRPPTCS